jgi:recombination protein RecA
MPSAQALRIQIEQALERRIPAALSPGPRVACNTVATGVAAVDDLLEGGLPIGAISELTGPECSGRTSLALAFLAKRTQEGHACAWIDTGDVLDPESAAASGVLLNQLLWIRCRNRNPAQQATAKPSSRKHSFSKPWSTLDQSIRATDLLLQAGGFASIVLDLGGIASEHARRIPLATWFRFRQAAKRTQCSLVVLGQAPCAQSSAETVLECAPLRVQSASCNVLTGLDYEVRRERGAQAKSVLSIAGRRKPPSSTGSAVAAWDMEQRA